MIKNVTGGECDVRIEFKGSAETKGVIAGRYIERIVCRAVDRVEMGEWFVFAQCGTVDSFVEDSRRIAGLA